MKEGKITSFCCISVKGFSNKNWKIKKRKKEHSGIIFKNNLSPFSERTFKLKLHTKSKPNLNFLYNNKKKKYFNNEVAINKKARVLAGFKFCVFIFSFCCPKQLNLLIYDALKKAVMIMIFK